MILSSRQFCLRVLAGSFGFYWLLVSSESLALPDVPGEEPAVLQTPETELALIKTDLDNLSSRLSASDHLAGRLGLGPQMASAERSWRNSGDFFRHQEWNSAIRELNNYLNQTQVPEINNYIKAQFMLGRSYEELGYKEKALRAYFRYLSTFLTAKEQDHDELIDVLRRMIPLASASGNAVQLRELLASITSLEIPKDAQPAVYFYAGKAAAATGEEGLAATWFGRTGDAVDPVLKAKSLYMEALIALNRQDFVAAEDLLTEVTQIDKEGATRDLARLALARLSVHRRKRETALKYYALINEEAAAFREATFESIYVHLDLKQNTEARTKSLLFLSRWPDGPEALQIRTLLAYLDMRSGDLIAARESIAEADQRLNDLRKWIQTNLSNRSTIGQTTLIDLTSLTGGQLPLSPTVREATTLFARLAEASRHLSDIRGTIRNTIYTIGRANMEHLRPFWVNRAEQLAVLGDELLKVGHRLAAAEAHLHSDRLTAIDRQKLEASLARRLRLLSPAASNHRHGAHWAAFATFADLGRKIAAATLQLRRLEAELAASRFLSGHAEKVHGEASRQLRMEELSKNARRVDEALGKALELLRRQRVSDLLTDSPHRTTNKFLSQYAASLNDEALVLAKVRDRARSTVEKLNAEDATKDWTQWQLLMTTLFSQIQGLDAEIGNGLAIVLRDLEDEEHRYDELQTQIQSITSQLEGQLGQSLSYIIDQYIYAIEARFSRNKKWQGDIDYLTYQSRAEDADQLRQRTELEQQILRDNLTDLQQGALWQWPK